MQHIVGIGPVPKASLDYFYKQTKDTKSSQMKAANEYLKYFLEFNEEELENLKILDTKKAAKDDVLYIALENSEHIREIYYRRSISGNEDLILRDYIPPQLHTRFTTLARKAAEKRKETPSLKTQIRWGDSDMEIHTKTKGSEDPFKKVDINEFMGDEALPEIDLSVKWKTSFARRNLSFKKTGPIIPSLKGAIEKNRNRQSLTRKHSTSSIHEGAKKIRQNSSTETDSADEDEKMEESKSPAKENIITEEIQI